MTPAASLPTLPDITEVAPLGEHDRACLDEVREVLKRHGALHRFGLTLLHQHFPMADDEVLMESVDPENRVLVLQPRQGARAANGIETSWRLDDPTGMQRCETICQPVPVPPGQPSIHDRPHYVTS